MKKKKRFLSILLALMMVMTILPIASVQSSAATVTLAQLKAKYPQGKYWNHVGSSGNNADGYTNTPCSSHNSTSTCNAFVYNGTKIGWQCFGFALQLGHEIYGGNPKNWGRANNLNNIKAGDIINYKGNNPGHTVFVTKVSGDTVYFAECNWGGRCLISWDRSLKKSQFDNLYNVYVAPYEWKTESTQPPNAPQNVRTSNGRTAFSTNEYITFYWDPSPTATNYWVYMWKDGVQIYATDMGNNTAFTSAPTTTGNYTLIVRAGNSAGYSQGPASINFIVGQYKIKYNANGGTGSMASQTVEYDKAFALAANSFKKSGYTFSGWNIYRSSDKKWFCEPVGWKTASEISSQGYIKKCYPDRLNTALDPSWYNGGAASDTITFYAVWKPNTLNVYFNANGGSISSDKYCLKGNNVYMISDGTKSVQAWSYNNKKTNGLANASTFGLKKTGYHFVGWGTTASGTKIFDQNNDDLLPSEINSDILNGNCSSTLYAIWEPNTLNVYFNANGGSISSDKYCLKSNNVYLTSDGTKFVQAWNYNNKKINGLVNASTIGLKKTGYYFAGWGTTASGTKIFDQDNVDLLPLEINSGILNGNCSSTLYAIWKANTYTVKYNANGGTGTTANSSHTYDTAQTLSANGFMRTGYTFLGWSTSSTATTPTYTNKQSVKNLTSTSGGTVNLYAVWQKNPVVLSSISILNKPLKVEYFTGEDIQTDGLSLKAVYSDGSVKIITSGYTVSQPDMSVPGTKTVTVTYGGKNINFTVTVKKALLSGDLNGDGNVDAADAVLMQRYDSGLAALTAEQLSAADVTGDGTVDAADAVKIQRYDAGLISEL